MKNVEFSYCHKFFHDFTFFLIPEISRAWPPCMRIVVKETNLKTLPIGTLFIVTCGGGTLGREGDHAILIPDINISKV